MINIVRLKYLDIYQGIYKQRTYIEDTTLSIEISGGTMESTKYNLALHVQQISTKGQLISKCSFSVFKSTKKTNEIFVRMSALASKKRLNQK